MHDFIIRSGDNKDKCYGYVKKCTDESQIGNFNSISIDGYIYLIEFISSNVKKIAGYDVVLIKKKYDEYNRFIGYDFIERVL